MSSARRTPLRWLLASAAAACTAAPTAGDEPARALTVRYEPAASFAALAAVQGASAGDGDGVQLAIVAHALAEAPGPGTLAPALELVTARRGAPFRAVPSFAPGLQVLPGALAAAPDGRGIATATAVAGEGLAARIGFADLPLPDVVATVIGGEVRFVLAARDDAASAGEQALVAGPVAAQGLTLFVPAPAPGRAGYAVVLRTAGAAAAAALAAARGAVAAGAAATSPRPATGLQAQFDVAARAVGERNRRPALLALASRLGLPRLTDLVLAADEPELIAITAALPMADAATDGWAIEAAAWLALAPRLQRGEPGPTLRACLRRQFGAVAADPVAFATLLADSTTAQQFDDGVRRENEYALADRLASARVAAAAWLDARGRAVPDYDPLASAEARAAALRRQQAATGAEVRR